LWLEEAYGTAALGSLLSRHELSLFLPQEGKQFSVSLLISNSYERTIPEADRRDVSLCCHYVSGLGTGHWS
jgi:hypothetical protein